MAVQGVGAVSPAGWGVESLYEAWKKGVPLPAGQVARPGWEKPMAVRNLPPPPTRPAFLAHPRLRRATAIGQHTVAAALEAMGTDLEQIQAGAIRPGIIVCVLSGAVNYSRRFYEETLRDPATASPLLFPETVFNSSASHLAAFLGVTAINYTLVGDDGTFLQGLALAADWLAEGRVDACVVVGAEENDWILSDALRLFQRDAIHAAGAGAIYLKKDSGTAELAAITDPVLLTQSETREAAVQKVRDQLPSAPASEWFLSDRVKLIFGEAFTASAAWQCVLACESIRRKEMSAANVSVSGTNQQAIGARFSV
ncbi:MAG TPA: beta-ketoacyl synthase N-terminal-like domain-containing protein [Desulfuromonadaceae bacterium]|nr:beta-ketoacyl synthase N-terminal-like domain-containing protein [Desulfuromonadaceae bacterium]